MFRVRCGISYSRNNSLESEVSFNMRYILLVIGLLFLIPACTPEPEIIIQEVEVIKEVEVEKILEVPVVEIREVTKEVVVEVPVIEIREVIKEVVVEVPVVEIREVEKIVEKIEYVDSVEYIYVEVQSQQEPAVPQAVAAEPAAPMCMHAELGLVECP